VKPVLAAITQLAVLAALLATAAACAAAPRPLPPAGPRPSPAPRPASAAARLPATPPGQPPLGIANRFRVGRLQLTLAEPPHTGPAGRRLGTRDLLTVIHYPLATTGPLPLLVFAPGFMQCGAPYSDLLQYWASAGYVVATVNFPLTDCRAAAPDEQDLVNQPADMSYAISRLLELRLPDPLAGRLAPAEIAVAGQSDGGDTVAALAAAACCTDHRVRAAAVLSGAEWPPMPGPYFPRGAAVPPMLFTQGTADTVNPPWTSVQLYRADRNRARFYLTLLGADHTTPYWGSNAAERTVASATLAFFDDFVLDQPVAWTALTRAVRVTGTANLTSDGR
jgi:dienelactone hydrolase